MISSWIQRWGVDETREILRGYVANMARPPRGGDPDQIRDVLNGACDLAIANHYYYLRLLDGPTADALRENVGVLFPDQPADGGKGTHMNATAVAILANAPHPQNALRFVRFLESPEIQTRFAAGNNEFPASRDAAVPEKARRLGPFFGETLNIGALGRHEEQALELCRQVEWP